MPNGLGKPPHVFGREREWAALADFAADPRQEVTLGIVSGRRRQGKTYLLRSLAAATGGFFFEAAEATEAESLRMFGAALARQAGSPADFSFSGWEDALRYFVTLAGRDPVPLIIDEFPYLVKASPALPSLLRREIDSHGPSQRRREPRAHPALRLGDVRDGRAAGGQRALARAGRPGDGHQAVRLP